MSLESRIKPNYYNKLIWDITVAQHNPSFVMDSIDIRHEFLQALYKLNLWCTEEQNEV